MALAPSELINLTAQQYLKGEMNVVLGNLSHFDHVGCPENIIDHKLELERLAQQVMKCYQNVYDVKEKMCQFGDHPDQKRYLQLDKN